MAWLHPVLGITAVLLILWLGMAGLRARQRDPQAPAARRSHRRFTPLAVVLVLLALAGGMGSVALLREDLSLGQSWHFRVALLCAGLAVASWLSSRRLHQDPRLRRLHPWIGLALMASAAAMAALGVGMLP
ncbi:DUF4079 family protein [Myxococcota bacterium]|nr:DUF4079 family protein [Myxococcota bacterium]